MNNISEFLQSIVHQLENRDNPSISMSLADVHAPGMFSLVVSGTEPGKLTRVFIAENKLKPFQVQLHTHRYPIKLTSITGRIVQHTATLVNSGVNITRYSYKSYLNGGGGLRFIDNVSISLNEFNLPPGSSIEMSTDDYHTISCSKGSIWIVEELGFKVDESCVLGVPFVTNDLYTQPRMFQINDKIQMVVRQLKDMINDYRRAL